jgi:hypothetical protein
MTATGCVLAGSRIAMAERQRVGIIVVVDGPELPCAQVQTLIHF